MTHPSFFQYAYRLFSNSMAWYETVGFRGAKIGV